MLVLFCLLLSLVVFTRYALASALPTPGIVACTVEENDLHYGFLHVQFHNLHFIGRQNDVAYMSGIS
jgi:hypothetical protein